jgi:predicted HicB family RNase H-like nuclease
MDRRAVIARNIINIKGENMNDAMTQQMVATAERLANAAETLDRVLGKLDAQQQALNAKVDRIVAAVEEPGGVPAERNSESMHKLQARIVELEKANLDLKAQSARMARKTLSPLVSALLTKSGAETEDKMDAAALDKTLHSLTVEQRIAVKAEMARAGMIG